MDYQHPSEVSLNFQTIQGNTLQRCDHPYQRPSRTSDSYVVIFHVRLCVRSKHEMFLSTFFKIINYV